MRIAAEGIVKRFGDKTVLPGISFAVGEGAALHVGGESGSGKTTLLRILAGLEKPDAGSLCFTAGGREITAPRIGMVFQEDRLIGHLTAEENVMLCAPDQSAEAVRLSLRELLPAGVLTRPVRELSGGERRRVCIIRAFAAPSDILLLDEPFNGLDEDNHRRAADYIRENRGQRPLIITSHEDRHLRFCEELLLGAEIKVEKGQI